jgi:hypothetical protein
MVIRTWPLRRCTWQEFPPFRSVYALLRLGSSPDPLPKRYSKTWPAQPSALNLASEPRIQSSGLHLPCLAWYILLYLTSASSRYLRHSDTLRPPQTYKHSPVYATLREPYQYQSAVSDGSFGLPAVLSGRNYGSLRTSCTTAIPSTDNLTLPRQGVPYLFRYHYPIGFCPQLSFAFRFFPVPVPAGSGPSPGGGSRIGSPLSLRIQHASAASRTVLATILHRGFPLFF